MHGEGLRSRALSDYLICCDITVHSTSDPQCWAVNSHPSLPFLMRHSLTPWLQRDSACAEMVLLLLVRFRTRELLSGILGDDQLAYLNILVLIRNLEYGPLSD